MIYNILCSTDDNYIPYCGIMLTSLFESNKENTFNVYIQCGNINDNNRSILKEMERRYDNKIIIINVEGKDLPDCPIRQGDHVSIAAYYRLFAPKILPKDIDKILYLDCDIIVNGNIDDLYAQDIDDYAYGAVIDEDNENLEKHLRLGFGAEKPYINSGVLLMNLKYWRENNVTERCFKYIAENPENVILHDQDTLNAVLNNEVLLLPLRFNLQTAMLYRNTVLSTRTKYEVEAIKFTPTIIHFTGVGKPWYKGSLHPYTKRFLHYKKLSLWKEFPLLENKRTFCETLLYFRNSIIWAIGLKKRPQTYIIEKQD